jgi:DNA polymerase-3 subunit alpha (Gram-positive type)
VLIAHNGINFDFRFINKKLIQHDMEPLTNPVIDTLQISRAVNKDLIQHSLGVIARFYHIDYDEAIAHRADFDADILYQV